MYGGISPAAAVMVNGTYLREFDSAGNVVRLIGVDPTSNRVTIDPDGVNADFTGDVLLLESRYLNWSATGVLGSLGYGFRSSAGTMQFKNSGGAWAAIAAAAASAGGWTDDGAIVRLDTGTDVVSIGSATATTSRFSSSPVTGNIFNDNGDDIDLRAESDANPNHLVGDSGLYGGVGAWGFGTAPTVSGCYIHINPPAMTGIAGSSMFKVQIANSSGALTIGTGTSQYVASLRIDEPNITLNGNVVDNAYSLFISGAPTEGTTNGAIWVLAGQVRFSGLPTSAAGLPSGTLWSNAGVVNVA